MDIMTMMLGSMPQAAVPGNLTAAGPSAVSSTAGQSGEEAIIRGLFAQLLGSSVQAFQPVTMKADQGISLEAALMGTGQMPLVAGQQVAAQQNQQKGAGILPETMTLLTRLHTLAVTLETGAENGSVAEQSGNNSGALLAELQALLEQDGSLAPAVKEQIRGALKSLGNKDGLGEGPFVEETDSGSSEQNASEMLGALLAVLEASVPLGQCNDKGCSENTAGNRTTVSNETVLKGKTVHYQQPPEMMQQQSVTVAENADNGNLDHLSDQENPENRENSKQAVNGSIRLTQEVKMPSVLTSSQVHSTPGTAQNAPVMAEMTLKQLADQQSVVETAVKVPTAVQEKDLANNGVFQTGLLQELQSADTPEKRQALKSEQGSETVVNTEPPLQGSGRVSDQKRELFSVVGEGVQQSQPTPVEVKLDNVEEPGGTVTPETLQALAQKQEKVPPPVMSLQPVGHEIRNAETAGMAMKRVVSGADITKGIEKEQDLVAEESGEKFAKKKQLDSDLIEVVVTEEVPAAELSDSAVSKPEQVVSSRQEVVRSEVVHTAPREGNTQQVENARPAVETVSREQIVRQVREKLAEHRISSDDGQVNIRLHPADLGELKISVRMDEQRLRVEIVAENRTVKDALMENVASLKEALARQNLDMKQFDVSTGSRQFSNQGFKEGRQEQQFASSRNTAWLTGRTENVPSFDQSSWRPRQNALLDMMM